MSEDPGGTEETKGRDGPFRGEETVGEILLAAREASGRSLEEISRETRIPAGTIGYLETDNFEALPAKVYIKGFLRTYAALLDLDVQHILDKYEVQTGQTHTSRGDLWEIEAETVEERIASPGILKRFLLPAVLVVALVVVVLRIDWRRDRVAEPPDYPPTAAETQRRDSAEAAPSGGEAREPAVEDRRREEAIPETLILTLTAGPADSVWFDLVTISAPADTSFFDFILFPGRTRTFTATEAIVLRKIGNAGGFTSELNGRRLDRPGMRGQVVSDIRITRDDLR